MRIPPFILATAILLSAYSSHAEVAISFNAGVIRQADSNTVPLGSIGVLVADTLSDGFGTNTSIVGSTLSAGSALGGSDNVILQVFTATDLGEGIIGFTGTVQYSYSGNLTEGDQLMLYWFPTITTVGLTIQTGVNYGAYRSNTIDTASSSLISFNAPSDGISPNLWVFDNVTNPGAVATPANLTALYYTAIPEPSSLALVAAGGALVAGRMLRRRKNG